MFLGSWRSSVLGLAAAVSLTVPAISQQATMSWPDATAQLASERTKAQSCVELLKRYGNEAQVARGQLNYTNAKADADAVIAGLIVTLSTGKQPASLATLQAKLGRSLGGLADFCGAVADLLPSTTGQKDIRTEIMRAAIEPLLKMLTDGVSALYNNHRADDELTRRTIQTQLEAARWPAFSEVKSAP